MNNDNIEKKHSFDKVIYTKAVWAGRRRYYFDILPTKGGDKYISITESRKRVDGSGEAHFDSQKIFLFKEDFQKFHDAFKELLGKLEEEEVHDDNIVEQKTLSNNLTELAPIDDILTKEKHLYSADNIDFDSL